MIQDEVRIKNLNLHHKVIIVDTKAALSATNMTS